ncbi:hypothetical protein BP5796_03000 [Coleophoma crateriformis]|uniref:Integrase zinc-binding domain-containing protein n=1 Tax=Coleophoma crateriformis TaxID=565419 RepID=A0A3D8SM04_9HELO|nr:hypothetical protein BP5796_03000 [Coleophoma crateriformis]
MSAPQQDNLNTVNTEKKELKSTNYQFDNREAAKIVFRCPQPFNPQFPSVNAYRQLLVDWYLQFGKRQWLHIKNQELHDTVITELSNPGSTIPWQYGNDDHKAQWKNYVKTAYRWEMTCQNVLGLVTTAESARAKELGRLPRPLMALESTYLGLCTYHTNGQGHHLGRDATLKALDNAPGEDWAIKKSLVAAFIRECPQCSGRLRKRATNDDKTAENSTTPGASEPKTNKRRAPSSEAGPAPKRARTQMASVTPSTNNGSAFGQGRPLATNANNDFANNLHAPPQSMQQLEMPVANTGINHGINYMPFEQPAAVDNYWNPVPRQQAGPYQAGAYQAPYLQQHAAPAASPDYYAAASQGAAIIPFYAAPPQVAYPIANAGAQLVEEYPTPPISRHGGSGPSRRSFTQLLGDMEEVEGEEEQEEEEEREEGEKGEEGRSGEGEREDQAREEEDGIEASLETYLDMFLGEEKAKEEDGMDLIDWSKTTE